MNIESNEIESNEVVKQKEMIWKRGLYMLLFAFLLGVIKFVTFSVVALQFFLVLVNGAPNSQLLAFGKSLSSYTYQIMLFLTFNSETQPYPFSEWPSGKTMINE
ncbi:MAG: DUF4389 domain-containing protein [Gammaproteobacteria bacterium]|nr:DUF4389 domain-containing protein [Gammaproteobacteria bacterium]